jgi:hypothetical protein
MGMVIVWVQAATVHIATKIIELPDDVSCKQVEEEAVCASDALLFVVREVKEKKEATAFPKTYKIGSKTIHCKENIVELRCLVPSLNGKVLDVSFTLYEDEAALKRMLAVLSGVREGMSKKRSDPFAGVRSGGMTNNKVGASLGKKALASAGISSQRKKPVHVDAVEKENRKIQSVSVSRKREKRCKKLKPGMIAGMRTLGADLDGDERQEVIALRKFASKEVGDFYQLLVADDDGCILWEGPKVIDSDNDYIFGEWDFGISMPEYAGDIDKDGYVELLAPAPQGDVSPVYFRILKWRDGRFVVQQPKVLMLTDAERSRLEWLNPAPSYTGIWVSDINEKIGDDRARVELMRFYDSDVKVARALVRFDGWGAVIERLPNDFSLFPPTKTKKNVVTYRARISRRDHYNLSGMKLKGALYILHQDRANYHLGRRDKEDEGESLFITKEARKRMDHMQLIAENIPLSKLEHIIETREPLLRISVEGDTLFVKVLEP